MTIQQRKFIYGTECGFFRGEKPRKPTTFMKTMVVGQIYTNIPKSI